MKVVENLSSGKTITHLSYISDTMAANYGN